LSHGTPGLVHSIEHSVHILETNLEAFDLLDALP
jgi:hypothetical protein